MKGGAIDDDIGSDLANGFFELPNVLEVEKIPSGRDDLMARIVTQNVAPELAGRTDQENFHEPAFSSSGYARSFSEIIESRRGQRMASTGSSQRMPRALSGWKNSDI